jgi:circadian clock protein KaiC
MVIAREPIGVPGFDDLVEGGIPKNSVILISGSPGTGKSIFAQHFLHHGATKFGQRGLYISMEQRVPEIYQQAARMGLDFKELERKALTRFMFMDISERRFPEGKTHIDLIKEEAIAFGAKRLVIDSLTPLANFPIHSDELAFYGIIGEMDKLMMNSLSEDLITRMQVHKLIMALKDINCTSIIISEIPKNSEWFSRDRVSEFMADGVIVLHYLGIGATSNRSLIIEKMRGTSHTEDVLPMNITDKGIVVQKPEEAYKV